MPGGTTSRVYQLRFTDLLFIHPKASRAMPPRNSKDKEVQLAQAEHADDSAVYSKGENDPIVPPLLSPFVERSYGNPIFKERDANRKDELAESSNVIKNLTKHFEISRREQAQDIQKIVERSAESFRQHDEAMRQYMVELRRIFEEGTRVICETGEESHRTLQAISEQVVEQVQQPRLVILPLAVEMPRQIQEAPILALGGKGINLIPMFNNKISLWVKCKDNMNPWRLLLLLQTDALKSPYQVY